MQARTTSGSLHAFVAMKQRAGKGDREATKRRGRKLTVGES
jgi:hypothetical protein